LIIITIFESYPVKEGIYYYICDSISIDSYRSIRFESRFWKLVIFMCARE